MHHGPRNWQKPRVPFLSAPSVWVENDMNTNNIHSFLVKLWTWDAPYPSIECPVSRNPSGRVRGSSVTGLGITSREMEGKLGERLPHSPDHLLLLQTRISCQDVSKHEQGAGTGDHSSASVRQRNGQTHGTFMWVVMAGTLWTRRQELAVELQTLHRF